MYLTNRVLVLGEAGGVVGVPIHNVPIGSEVGLMLEPLDTKNISAGSSIINISANLKRLRINAFPVATLGNDAIARECLDLIVQKGLPTDFIDSNNKSVSAMLINFCGQAGEVARYFYPGASIARTFNTQRFDEIIDQIQLVTLSFTDMLIDSKIVQYFHSHNVPIVWNVQNYIQACSARQILQLCRGCKFIVLNRSCEMQFKYALGISNISELIRDTIESIIMLDAQEAIVLDNNGLRRFNVSRSTNIVNYRDYYDVFVAGFVFGLLKGVPNVESAQCGCAAMSIAIESEDSLNGAPNHKALAKRCQEMFADFPSL